MKRATAVAAAVISACSCSLGPVGAWHGAAAPPIAIDGAATTVSLPGDRVAVLGGVALQSGQPTGNTLVYDARTDRWIQGAPIPEPRFGDTVVALHDGRVLDTGGYGQNNQGGLPILASTYIYDPGADSWRRAGDLPAATVGASGVTLADGRVLLVGGAVALPQPVYSPGGGAQLVQDTVNAELFDPQKDRWSPAGSLSRVRYGEALAALAGGGAVAAGGCIGSNGAPPAAVDTVEIFDAGAGTWRAAQRLPEPRCGATAIALSDGRVLVVGGQDQPGTEVQGAVVFDPKSGTWSQAGTVATTTSVPLNGVVASRSAGLSDRRVFLPAAEPGKRTGGLTTVIVGGQVYDPSSGAWSYVTSTEALTSTRYGLPQVLGAAPLTSNRVLILLENSALIFDANASPPQTAVLDSSSLTASLLIVVAVLVAAIGTVYVVGRLRS